MKRQRPRGVPPALMLVVLGVFLVVMGVTATFQTGLLSLHFSTAATNATVVADAAIVRTFANDQLTADDLAAVHPNAKRASRLDTDLAALAEHAGIERIDIRSPDGRILLTTEPGACGDTGPTSEAFTSASAGSTNAAIVAAGDATDVQAGDTSDQDRKSVV